jgi:hypothetical protein
MVWQMNPKPFSIFKLLIFLFVIEGLTEPSAYADGSDCVSSASLVAPDSWRGANGHHLHLLPQQLPRFL